jgi:PAS domain S-box-containing protein
MHELMQYVISHAQSAIAVHDRDMRYVYVSDSYLKQYHVKETDVIGKHHYEVFPDLPQKWRDVHQRVLLGAVEGKDEDPYVREDGTTDWTRWSCRPWYERDGSIGGLIVYTEVITERKRREEALQKSEERWRGLIETSAAWIWETDADIRHTYTNRFTLHCLGYEPAEFLAADVRNLVHPDDWTLLEGIVHDARTRKAGWSGKVLRWRHRDGSWRHIESSGVAAFDREGNFTGLRGVDHDITPRKRAEEALSRSEERFRLLVETSYDWVWEVDAQGRYTTRARA